MKKFYTLLAAVGAVASLQAQQLPNAGFEDDWTSLSPYTGGTTTSVGTTPTSWTIANVAGVNLFASSWLGTTTVGEKTDGYESTSAVLLKNSPNSMVKTQTVPGYITLGTTWNTANLSGAEKDGGSFGGIALAYRPDAMLFDYKRTLAENSNEQASVVAYLWTGSTSQANVPVNIGQTPTTITMVNRDRNILDMETSKGGEITKSEDFTLVSKINYAIQGTQDTWTSLEIPFEYFSDKTPEKINVIFGAGNYFSTEPEQGNELTIDNVKLLYYSRLASLSVNGSSVENFATDKYDYELALDMPESADEIEAETIGQSKTATTDITLDPVKKLAVITVANAQGEDADGETQHVYTLHFNGASAISDLSSDAAQTSAQYYNLQGLSVNADALVPGQTYIKVYGGTATKFVAL